MEVDTRHQPLISTCVPHTYSHMTVQTGIAHTRTHPSPGQTQHRVKSMLRLLFHKVKELHMEPVEPAQGLSELCSCKKDATDTRRSVFIDCS